MQAINASIGFDRRLAAQDIAGSRAHAAMLAAAGILSDSDADAIGKGLLTVLSEIEGGTFPFRTELEDIHMNVEARLSELIGAPAGRLHTARSRNDQVATDFRLWVRDQIDAGVEGLRALIGALLAQAEAGADWVMPGFTHLQTAQPVTWGHHMMAYVEMFGRDLSRFADARARMNECPLGAAALAGTSFPIDREMTAQALKRRPDLLLLIAGEGPALPALRAQAAQLGLGESVRFTGYLDRHRDLPDCYAAADVFAFASRTETQGLVLLEAMATGLPVVALARMGTVDILAPRQGCRVPADDPAAFAEAVVEVLSDLTLRERLGSEARAYARSWSDEAMAQRLAGLYHDYLR